MVLSAVTAKQVGQLKGQSIFFGHQSVGYNIIDGIDSIVNEIEPGAISIVESREPSRSHAAGIAHSPIGSNEDPASKITEFRELIEGGMGDELNVAMFKFCYVDINQETDIDALFSSYRDTMRELESAYPKTTFVYATVPLREVNMGLKAKIKRWLGKEVWGDTDNIQRNALNAKLRGAFAAGGRLADIAAWESTYPSGLGHQVELGGDSYSALIPEYSADGSHLNTHGSRVVAARMLQFLAALPQSPKP